LHQRPSQQHPKADDIKSSLIPSATAEYSRVVAPAAKSSLAMAPSPGSNQAAFPATVSSHGWSPDGRRIQPRRIPESSWTRNHRSHRRRMSTIAGAIVGEPIAIVGATIRGIATEAKEKAKLT